MQTKVLRNSIDIQNCNHKIRTLATINVESARKHEEKGASIYVLAWVDFGETGVLFQTSSIGDRHVMRRAE